MEEYKKMIFQRSLPNSVAVLVLGILSIITCWCYGIIGIILSIIALVLYKDVKAMYKRTPEEFTYASLTNAKAGRVCAIIGLVLSALWLVIIILIYTLGLMAISGLDTFIDNWY